MSRISSMSNSYRYMTLTIDEYKDRELQGKIYHDSMPGAISFKSVIHMILIVERICSEIQYPMKSMVQRQFETIQNMEVEREIEETVEAVSDVSELKGRLATVQLQVKYRYNATWQGELYWMEKDKREGFRSFLELLQMFDEELGEEAAIDMEPNKNQVFRIAIDRYEDYSIEGKLYQPPGNRQYEFHNITGFMRLIRHSIEEAQKPVDGKLVKATRVIPEQLLEVYRSRGKQATFIIRILFAENHTWQGTVYLRETEESVNFRSFLELILLMDRTSAAWTRKKDEKQHIAG